MNELKEMLINHAMNSEEGCLIIGEWDEIQEFGFPDFTEDDSDRLILSLWHDERVLEVWEREIENEPVLTIVV